MASKGKKLSVLSATIGATVRGAGDPVVIDVTHDSRQVEPGFLYVALPGRTVDGHDFVESAARSGAAAVCVERHVTDFVPELLVDDTRAVLGRLASEVHDRPSNALDVIGVTGTNGKTTVTHYIESIARRAGLVTGLLGTIHTRYAGTTLESALTTPEASDFQRLLAKMRAAGVSLVACEVSSHALDLGRVRATRFAVAAFTNLSQDHLDFHGDMDSYRAAKTRLFTDYEVGTAVFNLDDPTGAKLAEAHRGRQITVGRGGDVSIDRVESAGAGRTEIDLVTPWGEARATVPLVGDFNVSNLAIATACCLAAGIDFPTVVEALPHLAGVPGRFELVSGADPIAIFVDYAHTPEAVSRAVAAARHMATGRVIAVLGAGGDRDRAKRPAMGKALSTADLAVVTSDNPRSEVPERIVDAVVSGIDASEGFLVEVDRRRAIGLAVGHAEDGDVVLILGRGHEPYQHIAGARYPFDDRVVAAETLSRRRSSESTGGSGSMTP